MTANIYISTHIQYSAALSTLKKKKKRDFSPAKSPEKYIPVRTYLAHVASNHQVFFPQWDTLSCFPQYNGSGWRLELSSCGITKNNIRVLEKQPMRLPFVSFVG